jgi:hypothetical protein
MISMQPDGKVILYRLIVRCSEEWAAAIAQEEDRKNSPDLAGKPFQSSAWKNAAAICSALRAGYQAPMKFRKGVF